ncbi:class I SAM-dependent methyltransferase [Paenibacillus sp. TRM 82003]|nr:class I SAM-dependent methyltransferase [Paenibacillus sp. TRM 82003]
MDYIDMITRLGLGSAHPGGFGATLAQLERHPLPAGSRVLEVGCGTGRTACHLASLGHDVTAVDRHPGMLAKARKRAEALGTDVRFAEGDACLLPFEDGAFDVVFVESVTNFVPAADAFEEYRRVLTDGGVLYDRELGIDRPVPEERLSRICGFFGLQQLWTGDRWLQIMKEVGFRNGELAENGVYAEDAAAERSMYADPHELVDEGAFRDIRMWQLTAEYTQLMSEHASELSCLLLRATK